MKQKLKAIAKGLYKFVGPTLFIASVLANFYQYELYSHIKPRLESLEHYSAVLIQQTSENRTMTYRNWSRIDENAKAIDAIIPGTSVKIQVEGDK